jgi:hypothetical protein
MMPWPTGKCMQCSKLLHGNQHCTDYTSALIPAAAAVAALLAQLGIQGDPLLTSDALPRLAARNE